MKLHGSKRSWLVLALIGGLVAWQAGCSGSDAGPSDPGPNPDPDPEPTTGFIQVSTTTTGAELDPDGYTASLDGNSERSIGLNGVITFTDVSTGEHQVDLSGLAANCSVSGVNPATASVAAGATAAASFAVVCEALPVGSLEVATTVTNNFDPDGYEVFVAGAERGRIDVDGSSVFEDLPAGAQEVELREIAPNCEVDGDNPVTVTIPAGGTASAAFSVTCTSPPDGRILFRSRNNSTGWSGFRVMNADGSGPFILRYWPPEWRVWQAVWSPDGNKIAVNIAAGGQDFDIYVMNKDASGLTQLTTHTDQDIQPAWSPDGSQIAFVSRRTGREEIFVMGSDGSAITQITEDPDLEAGEPSWSPDGSKIVFFQFGAKQERLSVMDADGSNVTEISSPAPSCDEVWNQGPAWFDHLPQWSPDGTRIAFLRTHNCATDDEDILVMNADGTTVVNLTPGPDRETRHRWSPDGSRIVYEGYDTISVMWSDGTDQTRISDTGSSPDWGP